MMLCTGLLVNHSVLIISNLTDPKGPWGLFKKGKTMEQAVATKKEVKQKNNLRYQRDKDREMVRGIFKFYEVPGGVMEFMFKKYKEDQLEKYSLVDGQIYTIPLGVAKHLNNNCWYPVHAYTTDESGRPSVKVGQKVKRCGFQSLEFVDIDELQPDKQLITVEHI